MLGNIAQKVIKSIFAPNKDTTWNTAAADMGKAGNEVDISKPSGNHF